MKPKTPINRLEIVGERAGQRMIIRVNGEDVRLKHSEFKVLMWLVWARLVQNNQNSEMPQVVNGRIHTNDLTGCRRAGGYLCNISNEVACALNRKEGHLHEAGGDGFAQLASNITDISLGFPQLASYDDHEVNTMAAQIEEVLAGRCEKNRQKKMTQKALTEIPTN